MKKRYYCWDSRDLGNGEYIYAESEEQAIAQFAENEKMDAKYICCRPSQKEEVYD